MKFKFVSLLAFMFVMNVSAGHHEHGDHHAKDGKSKEWLIKTLSTAAPSFIVSRLICVPRQNRAEIKKIVPVVSIKFIVSWLRLKIDPTAIAAINNEIKIGNLTLDLFG